MIENSYNDFLREKLFELFPKKEAVVFMEESEKKRPLTIRTNTLLKRRKEVMQMLYARGVDIENIEWSEVGSVIYSSSIPIGATPEYLAGYYTIQGASSMLSVLNLEVQENMRILDMCAAPGGKTTFIASLMNNTGILFANDSNKDRLNALKSNIQRMNVRNCIVTNYDARSFDFGKFDRILLDAPCSGTGVISKDPSIKTSRTALDLKQTVCKQKELILKGFEMLKPGGIMIYSTCSVLPKENEEVVSYLLKKCQDAELCLPGVDVGKPGFTSFRGDTYHGTLYKARRIYPHVHNMDGFFYAKITRLNK